MSLFPTLAAYHFTIYILKKVIILIHHIKMTVVRSIKYDTQHKKIGKILIEDNINVIMPYDNEIFEYERVDGIINKVIVVEFRHKQKIVKQAFYQCKSKYEGTWLPFDGVKADVNDNNEFYTFLDTDMIHEPPFGMNDLMMVSYVLGGGVWKDPESEFTKALDVEPRISYFDGLNTKLIQPQDSIYLNHYINYAVTDNYSSGKPVKWLEGQELKSAFSFSNKMENSHQLEYTPKRIKGAKSRADYAEFYAKLNKAEVNISVRARSYCAIL